MTAAETQAREACAALIVEDLREQIAATVLHLQHALELADLGQTCGAFDFAMRAAGLRFAAVLVDYEDLRRGAARSREGDAP